MSTELIKSVLEDINKARKVLKLPPLSDLPKGNHLALSCPIAKSLPMPSGVNASVSISFVGCRDDKRDTAALKAIAEAWRVSYDDGSADTTVNIADYVRIFDNHQLPQYEEDKESGEDR